MEKIGLSQEQNKTFFGSTASTPNDKEKGKQYDILGKKAHIPTHTERNGSNAHIYTGTHNLKEKDPMQISSFEKEINSSKN